MSDDLLSGSVPIENAVTEEWFYHRERLVEFWIHRPTGRVVGHELALSYGGRSMPYDFWCSIINPHRAPDGQADTLEEAQRLALGGS